MRFLIKAAFWLSVAIILLPSASPERTQSTPQIGTTEAVTAASAAMSDMRQFCARQPDACTVGSQAITHFGHKAQAGAKMLYEFLNDRFGEHAGGDKPAALTAGRPSQHTLTPADLTPAWRGPTPRKESEARRAT